MRGKKIAHGRHPPAAEELQSPSICSCHKRRRAGLSALEIVINGRFLSEKLGAKEARRGEPDKNPLPSFVCGTTQAFLVQGRCSNRRSWAAGKAGEVLGCKPSD